MKMTFIGAAHEVTGSCTLIEACGKKMLVDCGMEQGLDTYENTELPVSPPDIDAVFLTHAHIDHSGKLPALVASGFRGRIYCTAATQSLCKIMLLDSAHIQETETEWLNRKAKRAGAGGYVPLYTIKDAESTLKLISAYGYSEPFSPFDGVNVRFIDAGHLLGSASIYIELNENGTSRTLLFSGDVGNISRPLIRDPQRPDQADLVVIESTYGDRLHGERPDYVAQLTEILQDTFDRGGNVIIPSFAVGRTQELLYLFRVIKEKGLIHGHVDFPVYVDSPLAVEATQIYSSPLFDYFDDETLKLLEAGCDPIKFDGLRLSVSSDESKLINSDKTPKVILSASGMCEAGRIRHHLKHNLWREDSTVLFVGYQSEGTLGRRLLDGERSIRLFGEEIAVRARIASLEGISGHADRDLLLSWLGALENKPLKVFVNHGADTVCERFAETVGERLGMRAEAPFSGNCYDIISGECIERAPIVRISRKHAASDRATSIYDKLTEAGKRLLNVIEHNKGGANKDLAAFTEKINALCDKYDR